MTARSDHEFPSGSGACAAWVYGPPGQPPDREISRRPCVVMAHGFSLTRHEGLAAYAERLAGAGAVALVFDYRHLGDSPGQPRQRFRKGAQLEDWRAAVAAARALPQVDPQRIVLWGFSFGGGHAVETAAADPSIAATIALCPFLDGLARVLSTPPRVAATVALHRPVVKARKVHCPLWVGLGEADISVSGKAVKRLARQAPQGELHRYPYSHFGPFLGDGPGRVAADQVEFLRRTGVLTD